MQGREKTTGFKRRRPGRFEAPTTRILCSCKDVSSYPEYLGNRSHDPCESAPTPRTLRLAHHACHYPITARAVYTHPLHGLVIGLKKITD
jgi:hypothetical protein